MPPEMVRAGGRLLSRMQLRVRPDPEVCPTEALVPDELKWPRIVRRACSDPMVTHESTGVHGRGTEEVASEHAHGCQRRGRASGTPAFCRLRYLAGQGESGHASTPSGRWECYTRPCAEI